MNSTFFVKIPLLALATLYSLPTLAQEECHGVSQIVVQTHDVNYLPGAADGTPISAQMPLNNDNAFSCNKNSGESGLNYKDIGYTIDAEESGLHATLAGGHSTPIYRVAGTNGIGFAIGFKEPTYCGGTFYDTSAKGKRTSVCNSMMNAQISQARTLTLQSYLVFYKIPTQGSPLHPGNQPASIPETTIGTASLQVGNSAASSQPIADKPRLLLSSFTVKYGSCAVTSSQSTINVNMGKVSKSEFHGVGSTAGSEKRFQIQVRCENNASIKVGFFGMAASGNKDALALAPQANSASGVGIVLSYGSGMKVEPGSRVPLNKPTDQLPVMATLNTPNQTQTLEFNAQYIQTDAQVMAGKADSMATFNLVYN
ncbi:fimbrial protein [Pantoea sp. KPR_PJ]|uniref:fimbrial protein n=1 Tax=Pantoea sp. KPR_PJ TaxID=2738375 RepID=UPI003529637E